MWIEDNCIKPVCCKKVKIMQLKIGRRGRGKQCVVCYPGNRWELKDTNKNNSESHRLKKKKKTKSIFQRFKGF